MLVENSGLLESHGEQKNATVDQELDDTAVGDEDINNVVNKEKRIKDDIENFTPEKRQGKMKQLQDEHFDYNIYLNNQCGFKTSRPLEWVQAVEEYEIQHEEVRCVWKYKISEDGNYEECRILMFFKCVKQIRLTIYMKTGVVMIKGATFNQFINEEFVNIKSFLKHDPTLPVSNETKDNENNKDTEPAFSIDMV